MHLLDQRVLQNQIEHFRVFDIYCICDRMS